MIEVISNLRTSKKDQQLVNNEVNRLKLHDPYAFYFLNRKVGFRSELFEMDMQQLSERIPKVRLKLNVKSGRTTIGNYYYKRGKKIAA